MPKTSVELVKYISEFVEVPNVSEFMKLPSGKIIGGPVKYVRASTTSESQELLRNLRFYYGSDFGDYVSRLTHPEFSKLVQIMSEKSNLPVKISSVNTAYEALNRSKTVTGLALSDWIVHSEVFTQDGKLFENPPTKETTHGGLMFDTKNGRGVDINTENAIETLNKTGVLVLPENQERHSGKVVFDKAGFSSVKSHLVPDIFCAYADKSSSPSEAVALYELPSGSL